MWKHFVFYLIFTTQCIFGWEISKLTTPEISTALSPIWSDDTQSLYFINYFTSGIRSSIYRYSFRDGIFYSAYIEGVNSPSFILPTNRKCKKCNKCDQQFFAVGSGNQVLLVKWNGKSTKAKVVGTIFKVDENNMLNAFKAGKTDSRGRFYGGTISLRFCNSTASSSFYRYNKKQGVQNLFGNLVSTTGIVFNENAQKMYHLDTCRLQLTEFSWDPKTGDLCNGRVVSNFPTKSIPLDVVIGMEIDAVGMLYVATYMGEVWKLDPSTGNVLDVIKLPVQGPAGLVFGGPNHEILYVITQSSIINNLDMSFVTEVADGSSIYMITGLGAIGMDGATPLNIKKGNYCKSKTSKC